MASRPTVRKLRSHHRTSSLHQDTDVFEIIPKLNTVRKSRQQPAASKVPQKISTISDRFNKVLQDCNTPMVKSPNFKTSILNIKKLKKPEVPRIQLTHKRTYSSLDQPKTVKHKRRLTQEEVTPDLGRANKAVFCASSATLEGFCESMPDKSNQDSVIECRELCPDIWFVAVCDGHGKLGGEISRFVSVKLPEVLSCQQNLAGNPKEALVIAIDSVCQQLFDSNLDFRFSGTTLIALLITPKEAICANVGDSRAILGGMLESKGMTFHLPLSRDHKPELPEEATRIKTAGGRIEPYKDERGQPLGPYRVWLNKLQIPGLAMSRSIGDSVAQTVGVSSEPELIVHEWRPHDNYVVLGSDGLFEFLPSVTVAQLVMPFFNHQDPIGACNLLVKEAKSRWEEEEEVIDDISVAVVFLKSQP